MSESDINIDGIQWVSDSAQREIGPELSKRTPLLSEIVVEAHNDFYGPLETITLKTVADKLKKARDESHGAYECELYMPRCKQDSLGNSLPRRVLADGVTEELILLNLFLMYPLRCISIQENQDGDIEIIKVTFRPEWLVKLVNKSILDKQIDIPSYDKKRRFPYLIIAFIATFVVLCFYLIYYFGGIWISK